MTNTVSAIGNLALDVGKKNMNPKTSDVESMEKLVDCVAAADARETGTALLVLQNPANELRNGQREEDRKSGIDALQAAVLVSRTEKYLTGYDVLDHAYALMGGQNRLKEDMKDLSPKGVALALAVTRKGRTPGAHELLGNLARELADESARKNLLDRQRAVASSYNPYY